MGECLGVAAEFFDQPVGGGGVGAAEGGAHLVDGADLVAALAAAEMGAVLVAARALVRRGCIL